MPFDLLDGAMLSGEARFAFSLYAALRADHRERNVLASPISVWLAMMAAWTGAAGDTADALAGALQIDNLPSDRVWRGLAAIIEAQRPDDGATALELATSIWIREGIPLTAAFSSDLQRVLLTEINLRDFADPALVHEINRWAYRHTSGRIASVVDAVPPDIPFLIANAAAFKGRWAQAFDPRLTTQEPFACADGQVRMVPMMRCKGAFRYFETAALQACELPFSEDERFYLSLFLPQSGHTLEHFDDLLDFDAWDDWMYLRFGMRVGCVCLPRFGFRASLDLTSTLIRLGMSCAFDADAADFTRMTSEPTPLWIGRVAHDAFVLVNEEGAEASAATMVAMAGRIGPPPPPPPPFLMIVDRPFFFAIRDQKCRTILFLGAVLDPAASA